MKVLVLALIAVVVLFAFKKKRWALFLAVFALPWQGANLEVGLNVHLYRVLILALLVVGLAVRRPLEQLARLPRWAIAFLVWALGISITQLFALSGTYPAGGLRSPTIRAFLQLVMFLMTVAPVLVLPSIVQNPRDVFRLGRIYILSMLVLTLIGWLQVIIWLASGVDITPIGLTSSVFSAGDRLQTATVYVGGAKLIRMCSFGGEPKRLGQSLALALFLLQAWMGLVGRLKKRAVALWAFFFLAMVATWSTSAFYIWIGGSVLLFGTVFYVRFKNFRFGRSVISRFTAIILIGATLLGAVGVFQNRLFHTEDSGLTSLLEKRLDRTTGTQTVPVEDFDQPIIEFLKNEPGFALVGTGLGNVHLHARKYVSASAWFYHTDLIFVAKVGALNLLSEVGAVGLLLMLLWMLESALTLSRSANLGVPPKGATRRQVTRRPTRRVQSRKALLASLLLCIWVSTSAAFLARIYVAEHFYLLAGVVASFGAYTRRARRDYS